MTDRKDTRRWKRANLGSTYLYQGGENTLNDPEEKAARNRAEIVDLIASEDRTKSPKTSMQSFVQLQLAEQYIALLLTTREQTVRQEVLKRCIEVLPNFDQYYQHMQDHEGDEIYLFRWIRGEI